MSTCGARKASAESKVIVEATKNEIGGVQRMMWAGERAMPPCPCAMIANVMQWYGLAEHCTQRAWAITLLETEKLSSLHVSSFLG